MKVSLALAISAASLGGARMARVSAASVAATEDVGQPYAPSPAATPFLSVGYREVAADVLFVRLRGYFGSANANAGETAALVDAIVALDPHFERIYEYGAHAMMLAHRGVTQQTYLRAIAVLEHGTKEFPTNWRLPMLAGQVYTQDLVTNDPAQQRAWNEKGTLLVESAVRKPGAPAGAAEFAAVMRTKLGQHTRAVEGLKEVLLLTSDNTARRALIDRLAKLEQTDAAEIAVEVLGARHRFEAEWQHERPGIPWTYYVLLGPRLQPGFAPYDLATGGRDLIGSEQPQGLEPVLDE